MSKISLLPLLAMFCHVASEKNPKYDRSSAVNLYTYISKASSSFELRKVFREPLTTMDCNRKVSIDSGSRYERTLEAIAADNRQDPRFEIVDFDLTNNGFAFTVRRFLKINGRRMSTKLKLYAVERSDGLKIEEGICESIKYN